MAPLSNDATIPPGGVVGVLGAGQLGRMFAAAAVRMGYRVHLFAPDADRAPASVHAERAVAAAWDDEAALRDFADGVDAVTLEFENVPTDALDRIAERTRVRPGREALHVAQNRAREKRFLDRLGVPLAAWHEVDDPASLVQAAHGIGGPALLKTVGFGYDGKGQARLDRPDDAEAAWRAIGGGPAVLEARIDLAYELSVVAARAADGTVVAYPPFRNEHRGGILDVSTSPAEVPDAVTHETTVLASEIVSALALVGVACVEFFVGRDGVVRVNEIAPRPHNSGHMTIEAFSVSQFEQQLRALVGLPLGRPEPRAPAAMANLLGDLWAGGAPDWGRALDAGGATLHLYGKTQARPGRKMGHLTALAETPAAARAQVVEARRRLQR